MKIIKIFFLLGCYLYFQWGKSQNKELDSIQRKRILALKTDIAPKIDGILDDEVWSKARIATNFIERKPNNGKPQSESFKTEVKILYDDTALYFSALLFDPTPEKILKELTERDYIGNSDLFGVIINGYNDKQQSLEFIVSAAGVQYDAKILNSSGEDSKWNAVWYSATKINEEGWAVEIKIPFSELRFPKKDVQDWGLNLFRRIKRDGVVSDWNFVDNKKGAYNQYSGILEGIQNINPPTRLSFLPYISTYVNSSDNQTTSSINGGMDVKYGINDAFTLDLTLIPDFGQASFDKSILNLSPFEQEFSEQRPFFTEGTELFNKGGLFYSRRVGGEPSFYPEISNNEVIDQYPHRVKLLNAMKISGRTSKELGIGVFNAVSEKTEVNIKNTETGSTRTEVVEPLTNYNVLVLDQRFNENSSISLVNTNIIRNGDYRDANVSGLYWDITNKNNSYTYFGNLEGSWVKNETTIFGKELYGGFKKIDGAHLYNAKVFLRDNNYNINDLGYTGRKNYIQYAANYNYRLLQPKGILNNLDLYVNASHLRRWETDLFGKVNLSANVEMVDRKFQSLGTGVEYQSKANDFYEPRTLGAYLKIPTIINSWLWFNSDARKKFSFKVLLDYYAFNEKARNKIDIELSTKIRLSDQFWIQWEGDYVISNREVGFVEKNNQDLWMGIRDRYTIENGITSQYTFNKTMALSFSFRHYYSEVDYQSFHILNPDGNLTPSQEYTKNRNNTFNTWNIDLHYTWWFLPGSQLSLLYRNAINSEIDESRMNFKKNFQSLFNEPAVHNISLKLSYYLNYNQIKRLGKRK